MVRTMRNQKNLPNKEKLVLCIRAGEDEFDMEMLPSIIKMCNLSEVRFVKVKEENAITFMINTTEFFIPLGQKLDIQSELSRMRSELDYYRGFLLSVMKKLDNERFVKNAPESVLNLEKKKRDDAESKIRTIEERIKEISNR